MAVPQLMLSSANQENVGDVQAASQQSPTETLVARFAKWYTPIVVLACVLLIIIPASMGKHIKVSRLYDVTPADVTPADERMWTSSP